MATLFRRKMIRYLALGDSYTVGESVPQKFSFPYQLAESLATEFLIQPEIIATTGWTTNELLEAIEERSPTGTFDLVTLLIGVNNQYRGYSPGTYEEEFRTLLNKAVGYAGGNKNRVIVLSIPDWGVTPFAKKKGTNLSKVSSEIDEFNAANRKVAEELEVAYVDITPHSRLADNDPSLIANDGLHPSGKMYKEWIKRLLPFVTTIAHSNN